MPINPTNLSARAIRNLATRSPVAREANTNTAREVSRGPFIAADRRPDVIDRITATPALSLEGILNPVAPEDAPGTHEWCITDGSEGSEGSEGKESKEGKDGSDGKESSDPDDLGIRSRVVGLANRAGPMM